MRKRGDREQESSGSVSLLPPSHTHNSDAKSYSCRRVSWGVETRQQIHDDSVATALVVVPMASRSESFGGSFKTCLIITCCVFPSRDQD